MNRNPWLTRIDAKSSRATDRKSKHCRTGPPEQGVRLGVTVNELAMPVLCRSREHPLSAMRGFLGYLAKPVRHSGSDLVRKHLAVSLFNDA